MLSLDLIHIFAGLWLKPMVVLLAFLTVVPRTFPFSAAASHGFLTCALTASVLGIAAHFYLPHFAINILPNSFTHLVHYTIAFPMDSLLKLHVLPFVLVVIYVFGVSWILFYQLFCLVDIQRVIGRADEIDDQPMLRLLADAKQTLKVEKKARLFISKELQSPVVFGMNHPIILLPQGYNHWPDARKMRVLLHELSHVKRYDWLTKVALQTLCALLWFVPLVWVLSKKIEWYAELACDDQVVNTTHCRAEYAEDLLDITSDSKHNAWLLELNDGSRLYARINHILDGRYGRTGIETKFIVLNILLCILLVLPFSTLRAFPKPLPVKPSQVLTIDLLQPVSTARTEETTLVRQQAPVWSEIQEIRTLLTVKEIPDPHVEDVVVRPVDKINLALFNGLLKKEELSGPALTEPVLSITGFIPQKLVLPKYPTKALRLGIEGEVMVRYDIDEFGKVINPVIVHATPARIFNKAVLLALQDFQYTPMQIDGIPIITKNVAETFTFKLIESTTD